MRTLESAQQRLYEQMIEAIGKDFPAESPAIFSPAAAAQDRSNQSGLYFRWTPLFVPYEFSNWFSESRAHVESCYIGDWSGIGKLLVRGAEALAFLSYAGMNNLSKFDIGQIKHHIQLDENGYVASEGVIYRLGEEEFLYTAGGADWTAWLFEQGSWNAEVENVSARYFIFEIQGPSSLQAMELAAAEKLRDINFNRGRKAVIAGANVHVLRTGISGELGYEVHGSADDAAAVWQEIVKAGEPASILQLGIRAQLVQHIEAGIATIGLDYFPASVVTPGAPKLLPDGRPQGSFLPPNGITDYFRYPSELGWGARGTTATHDFHGRDALIALENQGGASRKLVTLVWNDDDVRDLLMAPLSDADQVPEVMELPRHIASRFDAVLHNGKLAGISTSRVFSANLRKTLSLCALDRELASPGTEVTVVWGSPGTPQRELRAVVTETPIKPDRRRTDVTGL